MSQGYFFVPYEPHAVVCSLCLLRLTEMITWIKWLITITFTASVTTFHQLVIATVDFDSFTIIYFNVASSRALAAFLLAFKTTLGCPWPALDGSLVDATK